jgi:small conductance mechanosensitive channel
MRNALKILCLFLVLAFAAPAFAQSIPGMSAPAKNESVTVDPDSLKKLITTLESDTARKDFIDNLKALQDTQAKKQGEPVEEAIAPITKTLGVDTFTDNVIEDYQNFLSRNDLNSSTVGKLALTGLLFLTGAILIYVLRRGATRMLYWFDRAVAWLDLPAARMRVYAKFLRGVVTIGLMGLMLYTLTMIWNFSGQYNPFLSGWFKKGLGMAINIVFVIMLATAVWEAINALLQLGFRRADGANSARARTILPIVRNIVFLVFGIMFVLVLLSELGINILPLLAGAGIVGVAIGFGAQTMVKDFLSGFTLILEDVMRVGDVVNIGGYGGVIEKITLRKVQLRDYNGSVYTVPFSEIKTVTNMTKDFSMYEINIGVAYKDDPDKVFEVMRKVDEGMRSDPAFKADMLAPIEIAGVDKFADSAVIIKARLKTNPIKQWNIGREFNRRIRKAFSENNIEIPFPQQVTWNANPQVTVFQDAKELKGKVPRLPESSFHPLPTLDEGDSD